ncbi:hypothetical protein TeGR_g12531 [Tetraparma gracilis]|nr:hypothetical protein TeGR_g12531 [Tetraparma gracilis]
MAQAARALPSNAMVPLAQGGLGLCPLDVGGSCILNHPMKMNRELFVGNTPPGTDDQVLHNFLNAAMQRVGLALPNLPTINAGKPVVQTRVSAKFAFAQTRTEVEAANLLNLTGIPFMGAFLRITRPGKYAGVATPHKTWQELTGQATGAPVQPIGGAVVSAALPGAGGGGGAEVFDPNNKIFRELFVGNTLPDWNPDELKDFFNQTLNQVNLFQSGRDPVIKSRICGKFAFVECRTPEDAAYALNLNGIPYLGQELKMTRPSRYPGIVSEYHSMGPYTAMMTAFFVSSAV